MAKDKFAVTWTPGMLLTARLLKEPRVRRFANLTNDQVIAIFTEVHRQELAGKLLSKDVVLSKLHAWKRFPGERNMYRNSQQLSKSAFVTRIRLAMAHLSIPIVELPETDDVDIGEEDEESRNMREQKKAATLNGTKPISTRNTVAALQARRAAGIEAVQNQSAVLFKPASKRKLHSPDAPCKSCGQPVQHPFPANPINLHVITEPVLIEGATCHWSYFFKSGVFHKGWVSAENLSNMPSPVPSNNALEDKIPSTQPMLEMAHQISCVVLDDLNVAVSSLDLVQHNEPVYKLGGFAYTILVNYGFEDIYQNVMLCAGPPFCSVCKSNTTANNKLPLHHRNVSLNANSGLPMVHASDCVALVDDEGKEITRFLGRGHGAGISLVNKPLLDTLPVGREQSGHIETTVHFDPTGAGVLIPVKACMCVPELCIYCTNASGHDEEMEKECMPGAEVYEACRAAAGRSKRRSKAVVKMAQEVGDIPIDPKLELLDGLEE